MGNKKFIVINTKGGCGKSTTAIQILAPYLFERNGKKEIELVEFDSQNMNAATYSNSEIFKAKYVDITREIDGYLCDLLTSEKDTIFDIGGNRSATDFLEKLGSMSSVFLELVDVFFVPLGMGEQDALNAKKTAQKIREIKPSTKVIFVLTQSLPEYDLERAYRFFFDGDDMRKTQYLTLEHRPVEIDDSNVYGCTVYELGKTDITPIEEKIREALKNRDLAKMNEKNKEIIIIKEQKRFYENSILPNFQKIDEFLSEGKAQKVEKKAEKK